MSIKKIDNKILLESGLPLLIMHLMALFFLEEKTNYIYMILYIVFLLDIILYFIGSIFKKTLYYAYLILQINGIFAMIVCSQIYFPENGMILAISILHIANIYNIIVLKSKSYKIILLISFCIILVLESFKLFNNFNFHNLCFILLYFFGNAITILHQSKETRNYNKEKEINDKLKTEIKYNKAILSSITNSLKENKKELFHINNELEASRNDLKDAQLEINETKNQLEIKRLNESLVIHDMMNILNKLAIIDIWYKKGKCSQEVLDIVTTLKIQTIEKLELLKAHKRKQFNINQITDRLLSELLKFDNFNFISDYKNTVIDFNFNVFVSIISNLIRNSKEAYFDKHNTYKGFLINLKISDNIITIEDNSGGFDINKIKKGYSTKKNGHGLFLDILISNYKKYDFEEVKLENIENGTLVTLVLPQKAFNN